jgi:hypothetical protein
MQLDSCTDFSVKILDDTAVVSKRNKDRTMSRKKQKPPLRYFTFSPEMIHVTQEAMKVFTHSLARAEGRSEKVAFANETVQQVKSKLAAMRASVGTICLTGFDYNEKLVIAAATQLYMVDLFCRQSEHSFK